MKLRQTHSCALLAVPVETYRYVEQAFIAAGYSHAFVEGDGKPWIDMSGVGIVSSGVGGEPHSPLDRTISVSARQLAELINERSHLQEQVTALQKRGTEMATERQAQGVEMTKLRARVAELEEKERSRMIADLEQRDEAEKVMNEIADYDRTQRGV